MGKKDTPMASPQGGQSNLNAILDKGTQYEGKLTFEGSVLINGKFSGEIFTNDHLIIGENGQVSADIQAGTVQISGEVNGTIKASQRVEILASGRLRGELSVPPQALRIEPGAVFDGTCRMDGAQEKPVPRAPAESD